MENLIGIVLPFFVDIINTKLAVQGKVKYVVALAVSAVVAVALHFNELRFGDVAEFYKSLGIIATSSQSVYILFWEKSAQRKELMKAI